MARLELTPEERQFYETLKQSQGLCPVAPQELDLLLGHIAVFCGDCDQADELIKQQEHYCRERSAEPRIHRLSLNGGALRIAERTPIYAGDGADRVLLQDIGATLVMKGIRTVVLFGHAPCVAARMFGLNAQESVRLLLAAKRRVRATVEVAVPRVIVACKMHVDWGGTKRNTYFLKREGVETVFANSRAAVAR